MGLCSDCLAGCCRRYQVNITGYDIMKIAHNLGITPSIFLNISEISDDDYMETLSRKEALFVFTDNNCKRRYRIKLKKLKSNILPDIDKCFFLHEWETEDSKNPIIARCSIYGTRPLICTAYPAKFVNNQTMAIVPYVFDRQKENLNTPYDICKTPISEADFGMTKDEIIHLLLKMDYENNFFIDFADKWNKNPSSIADFLEELPVLYENRVYFETIHDVKPFTKYLSA